MIKKEGFCLKIMLGIFFTCLVTSLVSSQAPSPSISLSLSNYFADKGYEADQIEEVYQDANQVFWLKTNLGWYRFDGYRYENIDVRQVEATLLYQRGQAKELPEGVSELEEEVIDATIKTEGEYWVLVEKRGLGIYNIAQKEIDFKSLLGRNSPLYLSKENSFLFKDLQGNLWISSEEGLTLCAEKETYFEHHKVEVNNDIDLRKITSIYVPEEGNKIYALTTNSGGLFILEKGSYKVLKQIEKDERGRLLNMFYYERLDDELYLYTLGGIYSFHLETEELKLVIDPMVVGEKSRCNHMILDHQNKVWALSKNNYLFFYDPVTKESLNWEIDAELGDVKSIRNLPYQIEEDEQGVLHILTEKGFYFFDRKEKKVVRARKKWKKLKLPTDRIASGFRVIPGNRLLISMFGDGLYLFDLKRDSMYRPPNELYNNQEISDVFLDKNKNIWACTREGLLFFNSHNNHMQFFPPGVGFPFISFYYKYMQQGEDGYMYVGLYNSLLRFQPDAVFNLNEKVRLFFDKVIVNDVPLDKELNVLKTEELTLGHNSETVEIKFKGICYGKEKQLNYAYQLEGRDRNWIQDAGKRSAVYNKLIPGYYTFKLKVLNSLDDEQIQLRIQIKKAYWQQWWFYLLLTSLLTMIVGAVYKYRIAQVRKNAAQQNAFNKKIAELEMKALRAQMNPHFLFNSLNSVKAYIGQNDNRKAQIYLGKFSQLMRRILQNSKNKTVRLNDELEALRLYLDLEAMRFDPSFDYRIQIGEQVNEDFIEIPPLILQPYIENAIWHGLMHKDKGDRILLIDISRHGDYIKLVVEDNGIGRARAAKLKTRSASKHQSMGMQITGDRLRYLKEMYGLDAEVSVTDLKDKPNQDCGTRVEVLLPIPD